MVRKRKHLLIAPVVGSCTYTMHWFPKKRPNLTLLVSGLYSCGGDTSLSYLQNKHLFIVIYLLIHPTSLGLGNSFLYYIPTFSWSAPDLKVTRLSNTTLLQGPSVALLYAPTPNQRFVLSLLLLVSRPKGLLPFLSTAQTKPKVGYRSPSGPRSFSHS